ncbi:MAG: DNA polymerase/3'-5' exonuclease PolX [Acidobacteria bacterium]|nr:DNA polymerase/3'-5' exonuclease PolX [Acidobacteriota bacterium]
MDNTTISRVFVQIADLLEIKGENPFRIRAYRTAAEVIANSAERLSGLDEPQLLRIPGIGKDLARKIQELAATGHLAYHQALLQEFPSSLIDILRLQGVGAKTVALLHTELGVRTLEDLEHAARGGRLRDLRGMGARKEELILKALDERRRREGRHLMAHVARSARGLIEYLQEIAPAVEFIPVGSLRRGCETCGDLDVLAVGGTGDLMDRFAQYGLVERVLVKGDTKSSVMLRGGLQADLRLVPQESRGAAMQYFTGSKLHNIVLRDRAMQRGLKLNEYGLYRVESGERIGGATEEEIYERLGLACVPPELRENRGEIEAAEAHALPRLVALEDLKGDLHAHTNVTDGRDDIEAMALGARAAGLSYLAITDHSQSLSMANGLDERRALEHAARIRALNGRVEGVTLLAGIECDIRPDGAMDLADDCLAQLDLVIASVHSAFNQDESQMTRRILRALECPFVDVLGHPTGRLILRREPYRVEMGKIIDAAARQGVALEINCQVDRLDLNDAHARLARERGANIVIATDAHAQAGFSALEWGALVARRAWLRPEDVLNTKPVEEFQKLLRRHR